MHAESSNPGISSPARVRRGPWRALLVWSIAVSAVTMVVAVPYAMVNAFRIERDAACIRDAVTGEEVVGTDCGWSRRVEVRVGGCILGLARLIAGCTDLPAEARHALRAARSASVGVYQWRGADLAAMHRQMGATVPVRVGGRDWVRVVSVHDGSESVVVLTPACPEGAGDTLELCVVVLADSELVVVSVEVDPQPLVDLVQPHLRDLRREIDDAA